MAEQAYCVKCRKKVDIEHPEKVTMKNGRPAMKGKSARPGPAFTAYCRRNSDSL